MVLKFNFTLAIVLLCVNLCFSQQTKIDIKWGRPIYLNKTLQDFHDPEIIGEDEAGFYLRTNPVLNKFTIEHLDTALSLVNSTAVDIAADEQFEDIFYIGHKIVYVYTALDQNQNSRSVYADLFDGLTLQRIQRRKILSTKRTNKKDPRKEARTSMVYAADNSRLLIYSSIPDSIGFLEVMLYNEQLNVSAQRSVKFSEGDFRMGTMKATVNESGQVFFVGEADIVGQYKETKIQLSAVNFENNTCRRYPLEGFLENGNSVLESKEQCVVYASLDRNRLLIYRLNTFTGELSKSEVPPKQVAKNFKFGDMGLKDIIVGDHGDFLIAGEKRFSSNSPSVMKTTYYFNDVFVARFDSSLVLNWRSIVRKNQQSSHDNESYLSYRIGYQNGNAFLVYNQDPNGDYLRFKLLDIIPTIVVFGSAGEQAKYPILDRDGKNIGVVSTRNDYCYKSSNVFYCGQFFKVRLK